MKLAKVITINDNVEVIVKKVIEDGQYGFTLNFVGVLENESLVNTTLTMTYGSEMTRDKDFFKIDKNTCTQIGATLPTFKHLIL